VFCDKASWTPCDYPRTANPTRKREFYKSWYLMAVPIATRLPLKGGNACTRKYVRSISPSRSWKLDCEDRRLSNTQPGSQVSHREWLGHNHVLKKRKSNINPDRVQEIRKEERAHETRNLPHSQRFLLNPFSTPWSPTLFFFRGPWNPSSETTCCQWFATPCRRNR
jgi:hypothetical protein